MPFDPRLVDSEGGEGAGEDDGLFAASFLDPSEPSSPEADALEADAPIGALERELPDHLLALVEQLVDDADQLAATYPAGEPEVWLARHARPAEVGMPGNGVSGNGAKPEPEYWRPGYWHRAVVAVLVIGLGFGTSALWFGWGAGGSGSSPATHEVAGPIHTRPLSSVLPVQSEQGGHPVLGIFETLSGPEREALLDVMEAEGHGQPSLAI